MLCVRFQHCARGGGVGSAALLTGLWVSTITAPTALQSAVILYITTEIHNLGCIYLLSFVLCVCRVVEFKDEEFVKKAIEVMNKYDLSGRPLNIKEVCSHQSWS